LCIDQNLKSKTKFFAQMRIKFYQGCKGWWWKMRHFAQTMTK
jgi:hypothetical protein